MNDRVLSHDELTVRERLGVVRDVLQAQRARRGALAADPCAALRVTLASFGDRVRTDGWTRAFDALVATAQQTAAQNPSNHAEVVKIIQYLTEIEPHIVRLAQKGHVPTAHEDQLAPTNQFLRASTGGVPALHRLEEFVAPSASTRWMLDFVEPGALMHLQVLGRDVLDELASLALLRSTAADEAWTKGEGFELRLLQVLDAAIALNRGPIRVDIVRAARTHAEAFPVVDPHRWFVPTFLLACADGERVTDALREGIIEAPKETLTCLADAVCLGSNPEREAVALSLLEEDDRPELLCFALDVLARVGKPIERRFLDLVDHPHIDVATRAMTAASFALEADDATRMLVPLLAQDGLSVHVASVLAMLAPMLAAPHLREVIRRGSNERASAIEVDQAVRAAEVLAMLGQTRDQQLLIELARVTDEAFCALATLGTPEALEFLRETIVQRGSSWSRANACILPIERMTGILEQDESTAEGQAMAREQWLRNVRAFVIPKEATRVRLGQPFHPAAIVAELLHPETLVQTRKALVQEARILGARRIPVDLQGWIMPQRAWLDTAKQAGWPAPTRRS